MLKSYISKVISKLVIYKLKKSSNLHVCSYRIVSIKQL